MPCLWTAMHPECGRARPASRGWTVTDNTTLIRLAILLPLTQCGNLPVFAQNRVSSAGWEGFATRTPEGRLEGCILYNRTVDKLNASPYDMLGLSRDTAGKLSLLV